MRERNGITSRLDKIIDLLTGSKRFGCATLLISILALIIALFPDLGNRFQEQFLAERPKPQIQPQPRPEPPPPPIITSSNIVDRLKNELRQAKRFELLEGNVAVISSNLSLNELGVFIKLFQPESYKLKVVRLLQPRIKSNYSNNELEEFEKLFNSYKRQEATALLPKRRN